MSKKKKRAASSSKLGVKIWAEMTQEERKELLKEVHARVNKKETPISTYVYKECHTGSIHVFDDPKTGLEFYGGGSSHDVKWTTDMLLIDLADRFAPLIEVSGVELPKISAIGSAPRIAIEWPDMNVPSIERDEWIVILDELREAFLAGKIPKKILICCVGGHGRTGTCLSIFAGLTGAVKTDPVKFVRDNYCDRAVESNKQLDYIEEITEIEVLENTPIKGSYSSGISGWWNKDKTTGLNPAIGTSVVYDGKIGGNDYQGSNVGSPRLPLVGD